MPWEAVLSSQVLVGQRAGLPGLPGAWRVLSILAKSISQAAKQDEDLKRMESKCVETCER